MLDYCALVKKSSLGKVLKNMCEHALIALIRKPSKRGSKSRNGGKGISNSETRLYYPYPVKKEVLLW